MSQYALDKYYGVDFDKEVYIGRAKVKLVRLDVRSGISDEFSIVHFTGGFLKPEGLRS